ncbi:hypothetical protein GCM10009836_23990 [Pseudonocardia ailaonensis]|uniref:Type I-U CRISPR-associated protein Cas5/Cas6 n=1 Tax=Pseudonocardia ailaonensis TaxID=367279 RepID=A0ABN2MY17_9PSEU
MGVTISIDLLSGVYDAADPEDPRRAEWPPHPARLYCALVAAARDETDRAALQWLERQDPPLIIAAGQAQETSRSGYVVVNAVSAKGGNQSHPGRTNGLRVRSSSIPAASTVRITWCEEAPAGAVEALDRMARRIPYLGRSTGIALVAAAAAADECPEELVVFEPCSLLDREHMVRIPYPGFLSELDSLFAADRQAWEASRYQPYRRRSAESAAPAETEAVIPSVYTELVTLRFSGLAPQASLTVPFTTALRKAVLAVAGDSAPAALHGHGADGRPHVAFLALPDVGGEYSDGHLLGLAVAVPDLPPAERRAVLAAVGGLRRGEVEGTMTLNVPPIGKVELLQPAEVYRPWGASPQRWRRGSRRWVSATPVVLDRFPKRPEAVEQEIRTGLRKVGLPEPLEIAISKEPLVRGAARIRPPDLPRRAQGRPYRHIAVTFDRRVSGPVLVGAGRYLGIGLLAPVGADDDR